MGIYKVELLTVVMVQADSEEDAAVVAKSETRDIHSNEETEIDVIGEVRVLSGLTDGWTGTAIPYGGDGRTMLKYILPK